MPPARPRWRSPRRGSAGKTSARRPCHERPPPSPRAKPSASAALDGRSTAPRSPRAMRVHRGEVARAASPRRAPRAARASPSGTRDRPAARGSRPRPRPRSASSASARRMGSRTMRHASLTSTAFAERRLPLARAGAPTNRSGCSARESSRCVFSTAARSTSKPRRDAQCRERVHGTLRRRTSGRSRSRSSRCGFLNLNPCCISVCSHSSSVPLEVEEALGVDDDAHGRAVAGRVLEDAVARVRRAVVELDDVREPRAAAARGCRGAAPRPSSRASSSGARWPRRPWASR